MGGRRVVKVGGGREKEEREGEQPLNGGGCE